MDINEDIAKIISLDPSSVSDEVLQEVANWKLEAKNEDNDRYFYHVKEVASIENGSRSYVIGRKGSGKTAISEYLGGIFDHETFSEKLTFKNFPFNSIYELKNDKYQKPNQYITLWKYVIYNSICKMMLKNQAINQDARDKLGTIYGGDDLTLDRRIGKWVGKEFALGFLTFNVKVGVQRDQPNNPDWIERVNILEDFIKQNIDGARYYVIFDELDEDYRNMIDGDRLDDYTALITSLFKAVQDVKSNFKSPAIRVFPVVFLRDDIYELLRDSDKNKWNDFKIELTWDEEKAKRLVAFRITRALDPSAPVSLPFDVAWPKLVGASKMSYGTNRRNQMDSFGYIARSTYLRPRDFVKYLQECAERALNSTSRRITSQTISDVDTDFSNYLKNELIDELFAIIPSIAQVLDVISLIGKWNFSYADFDREFKQNIKSGADAKDVSFVLQVLFIFSVIGTALRHDYFVFRYNQKSANINYKNRIVVHRGLFKSLQIV